MTFSDLSVLDVHHINTRHWNVDHTSGQHSSKRHTPNKNPGVWESGFKRRNKALMEDCYCIVSVVMI